jgi:hypothetical protein
MGRARGKHGGEEAYTQGFVGKAKMKEPTRKT